MSFKDYLRCIKQTIFILIFLVAALTSSAQLTPKHHFLTTEDGLSSNIIYEVFTDSKGYLWIGSNTGIEKYNGRDFVHFSSNNGLLSSSTFELIEDGFGRIWTANFANSLCYIKNDSVHYLPKHLDFRDTLNNGMITSIVTHQDTTWVSIRAPRKGMTSRIALLPDTFICTAVDSKFNGIKATCTPNGPIWCTTMHQQTNGKININIQGRYFHFESDRINTGTAKQIRVKASPSNGCYASFTDQLFEFSADKKLVQSAKLPVKNIFCLYTDHLNNLLIGTNNGLYIYENGDFSRPPKQYFSDLSITSITQDQHHGYYLGTLTAGVMVLPSFSSYQLNTNNKRELPKTINGDIIGYSNGDVYRLTNNPVDIDKLYNVDGHVFSITPFGEDTIFATEIGPLFRNGSSYRNSQIFVGKKYYQYTDTTIIGFNRLYYSISTRNATIATNYRKQKLQLGSHTQLSDSSVVISSQTGLLHFTNQSLTPSPIKSVQVPWGALSSDGLMVYGTRGPAVLRLNITDNSVDTIFYGSPKIPHITEIAVINKDLFVTNGSQVYTLKQGQLTAVGQPGTGIFNLFERDSEVWFLEEAGVSKLDPSYRLDSIVPQVTEVLLDGKMVDKRIVHTLPAGNHFVNITYETINFCKSRKVSYRIDNQTDWITSDGTQINLPLNAAGTYTLSLATTSVSGEKQKFSTLVFEVLKPYYLQSWFIITIIIWIILLSVLFAWLYFKKMLRKKEEQKVKFELQNKVLRSQINPHFIFNSLGSLQDLILNQKNDAAISYLLKFSKLFRAILAGSRESQASLYDELETLKHYMELERIRFNYAFDYNINTHDVDTFDTFIPSLLLQPYIENAIVHGIAEIESDGLITLDIDSEDDWLIITITDNGIGRKAAAERKKSVDANRKSVGLDICAERVALFNGEESDAFVEFSDLYAANIPKGTSVRLKLIHLTDD